MKLLNQTNDKLQIFESGVRIDKSLPKYSMVVEENGKQIPNNTNTFPNVSFGNGNFAIPSDFNFEEIADADTHKINVIIKKNNLEHLGATITEDGGSVIVPRVLTTQAESTSFAENSSNGGGENIIKKLTRIFKKPVDVKKTETEPVYEIDVISFFSNVKYMAKDSVESYKNRVSGYIKALKNADKAGQEALKEKLLKSLIVNKYESVLYSMKYYYAVTEEQVVEFAKKCEKGLSLDYVSNFIRPIPEDIVDTIHTFNNYEIFDNYVVLHYDPEQKAISQTIAEKQEEERKKKDPILFGVISGSRKLYYIADWVDEYCNLTLNEFVDTLDIEKDDLKMSEKIDI